MDSRQSQVYPGYSLHTIVKFLFAKELDRLVENVSNKSTRLVDANTHKIYSAVHCG
ncbi:predicted protein [Micromonas commoda]|uniref:Uncharacterized protein n=1 Tax=Micromonas commoda (strain RCC299 / NOUM17 / CCMP2709) TaxID=296587 RepID=C1EJI6_MICCC|nr:predicted protein [Micromonas commoda]ACO68191.1 predicted protein [Micromonas commoda]|eukprot:XP_002506933.1 predicted protein [Micromonas commoda]